MGTIIDLSATDDLVEIQLQRVGYEWKNRQIRIGERIKVPRALAQILLDRNVATYPRKPEGIR